MTGLHPELTELLTEFASCGVEYLVVGGWAVGVHSEPRYTKDLDLLVGTDAANLARLAEALKRYGVPSGLVEQAKTMTGEEFIFFGVPPLRVDLLGAIPGVEFEAAWIRRKTVSWSGVDVHVLGLDDLRDAKRAAGRAKDLEDLEALDRVAETLARG